MNTYRINEIFYSLQGEGHWAGRPAVFIRFSGCNLKCPFCDTDHASYTLMSIDDIKSAIANYPSDFIVLTGGEPSLYVDDTLIDALHDCGKFIAIETNGTRNISANVDWVTLSPKDGFVENANVVIKHADEVKLVFDGSNMNDIQRYSLFPADYHYIQPCDTGNAESNKKILADSIAYCLEHPNWSLSLQQHKIIGIQ